MVKQTALGLLAELQAARKRCDPNARPCSNTAQIEQRLRDGYSVEDLRHVVACWEALVRAGKRGMDGFNSVSPFRADNIAQYVEMGLDAARRPFHRAGKGGAATQRGSALRGLAGAARTERERVTRNSDVIDVPSRVLGEGDEP